MHINQSSSSSKGTHPKLTKSLKLIQKLMQYIKAPLRNQIQLLPFLLCPLLRSLGQYQIKQLPISVPPLNPIRNAGTLHRLQMTQRELIVQCEEEFIVGAFGGNGIGCGPGGVGEIFGGDVAEGSGVEGVEFGGDEGAAGGVVEVKDEVFDAVWEEVVGHGQVVLCGGEMESSLRKIATGNIILRMIQI